MMRCIVCGNMLPPDAKQCPFCGTHTEGAQEPPTFPQGNPPADGGYGFAASDAQNKQNRYATPAFHTYRKQMFTGFPQSQQTNYQPQPRDGHSTGGAFMRALGDLPMVIRTAFTDPMGTLQGMVRRDDKFSGGIMVVLSLILAFLAGIILTNGLLGMLFSAMGGLTGLQLADSAASLNQGVTYMAGKVSISIGGVAAVCQLIAALIPVAITMAYLGVFRKLKLSFVLASGLTAIVMLPNVVALLLAAVLGLLTPYLAILVLLFGVICGYVLLSAMTLRLAEADPAASVPAQAGLICLSELVKLILIAVVGGVMMNSVIQTLAGLTSSVSGLL